MLRDRRTALNRLALDVVPGRAEDPPHVDPAVLVEALVLDRDDRVLQPRRDLARGHDHPRLRPAQDLEDRVPVTRVHVRVRLLALLLAVWGGRPHPPREPPTPPPRGRPQTPHPHPQKEGGEAELSDAAGV